MCGYMRIHVRMHVCTCVNVCMCEKCVYVYVYENMFIQE